jgi:hypothetical protein
MLRARKNSLVTWRNTIARERRLSLRQIRRPMGRFTEWLLVTGRKSHDYGHRSSQYSIEVKQVAENKLPPITSVGYSTLGGTNRSRCERAVTWLHLFRFREFEFLTQGTVIPLYVHPHFFGLALSCLYMLTCAANSGASLCSVLVLNMPSANLSKLKESQYHPTREQRSDALKGSIEALIQGTVSYNLIFKFTGRCLLTFVVKASDIGLLSSRLPAQDAVIPCRSSDINSSLRASITGKSLPRNKWTPIRPQSHCHSLTVQQLVLATMDRTIRRLYRMKACIHLMYPLFMVSNFFRGTSVFNAQSQIPNIRPSCTSSLACQTIGSSYVILLYLFL